MSDFGMRFDKETLAIGKERGAVYGIEIRGASFGGAKAVGAVPPEVAKEIWHAAQAVYIKWRDSQGKGRIKKVTKKQKA